MKLRKLLLNAMPVALLSTGLASGITSCGSTSVTPKVKSHSTRSALLYNSTRNSSTGKYYYVASGYGLIEVHHFNGSQIGYLNVDDYVNAEMQFKDFYPSEGTNYSSATNNYKTIITNSNNNSTATIDYQKQTITFSDYDMFTSWETEFKTNPLAHGAGGGDKYFHREKETDPMFKNSVYVSGGEYTIDLTKYNITAYYDKDKGYLPYDVFRNIINTSPRMHAFYNGVNFYQVIGANNVYAAELYSQIGEEATILTKEYMEYCYNLLALTLDQRFGLYERLSRAPETKGQVKKFFANGAYAALEPYKERLTSLTKDVANDAMFDVFNTLCDDGGHAGYNGVNINSSAHEVTRGPEKTHTFDVDDMITEARARTADDGMVGPQEYWDAKDRSAYDESTGKYYDNYLRLYGAGDDRPILYITFDSFEHVSKFMDYEELDSGKVDYNKVVLNDITTTTRQTGVANYYLDTIRMTMAADRFIKTYNSTHTGQQKINDVVVDLSNNGGGTVYTEHFIASWLCGGVNEKIWNPHTKAYAEYRIEADVDGDGDFDQDDYLPKTTNVYCITSDTSFSCGNMLPCNLVDNRDAQYTHYIGSASGGGACFVDSNMHIGLGNVFRSSSNSHMLRGASTKENPITVESGHLDENDKSLWFMQIASTWDDYLKFVNRGAINTEIRKH